MKRIITTDFGSIHKALNNIIIGEVKKALRLLPDMTFKAEGETPLCRIVISPDADYSPRDFAVMSISLDKETNIIHMTGKEKSLFTQNDNTKYSEDDDLLDITDFEYLLTQMKYLLPDGTHCLINGEDIQSLEKAILNSPKHC